jgi:hypothetical protein
MSEATKKTLTKFEQFLEVIEAKINETIAHGNALPSTQLAKDIGPTFGWEWPQAYHFINAYVDERPELFIKKGPKGGVALRPEWMWVDGVAVPRPAPVVE